MNSDGVGASGGQKTRFSNEEWSKARERWDTGDHHHYKKSETMTASPQDAAPARTGGAEKTYFDGLDAGKLQLQRCDSCERAVFYPRMICPHCGGGTLSWFEASGRGTVYSTTVVHRKPDAGGDYNVALIDLAEGVRMMSRVDGVAPDAVRIGMAVQAAIETVDGHGVVIFRA